MTRPACLFRNVRGSSSVEFALIAPVMLMTLFGMFDLGHGMYTKSLLEGAIEKAARNSSIEAATTGSLDARVTAVVRQIAPGAILTFTRSNYANFSNVGQPEDFTDVDGNNACNSGEPFEDANGNGTYDNDRGRSGNGGARDAVLYKVGVAYPRVMPIGQLIGGSSTQNMTAIAVLRNQPYGLQNLPATTGNCP